MDRTSGNENNDLSLTGLRARGWTPATIRRFLGEPDATRPNPVFRNRAPMQLFEASRVEAAEQHSEWQLALKERIQRRKPPALVAPRPEETKAEGGDKARKSGNALLADALLWTALASQHHAAYRLERTLDALRKRMGQRDEHPTLEDETLSALGTWSWTFFLFSCHRCLRRET